jgi:hypothetical protein
MEQIKQEVLDFIKFNGPVLPAQVGKKIEKNLILTGALLSDLLSDKVIRISIAKVGGSPVYYVLGQENKLGMLYDYLPSKEKEAYNLLREKKVVKDNEVGAGIRVAFRNLRDFAVPFKNNEEIYWKWYLLPNEQVDQFFSKKIIEEKPIEEVKPETEKLEVVKKVKKVKKNEFFDEIKNYLGENKIEIVKEELNKRNEVSFVGAVNSDIGKLDFLIVGRSKKKINDSDLTLAYSKGSKMKLPVIFVSSGSLTKKAETYLEENKGYIVFKSMNS